MEEPMTPPTAPTTDRSRPNPAVLVASALAVIGVLAVVIFLATRGDPVASGPSPSASASASPSASASASPSASATPTETATPPAEPGWTLTQTFGNSAERPTFVFDATAWDEGFVAIGIRLDNAASDVGPYIGQPLLWTSADGREWQEREIDIPPPENEFDDNRVEHIVAIPDGRLLIASEGGEAWVSEDAATWSPVDLDIQGGSVDSIAANDLGLVMLVTIEPDAVSGVWSSEDGLTWERTHDPDLGTQLETVAGGPEGFVVVGALRGETDRPVVLASSDGREWVTAPDQPAFVDGQFPLDVAPLGPDWIATGAGATEEEQRSMIWRSPNGLDWTQDFGPADPAGRNTYYATDIAGDGGHVILSPAEFCLCGAFQDPTVGWSTTDGSTWTPVDPDASYVTEVVAVGSTVIAVGNIGRGESAAFWILAP
jgi:hypothetical protein